MNPRLQRKKVSVNSQVGSFTASETAILSPGSSVQSSSVVDAGITDVSAFSGVVINGVPQVLNNDFFTANGYTAPAGSLWKIKKVYAVNSPGSANIVENRFVVSPGYTKHAVYAFTTFGVGFPGTIFHVPVMACNQSMPIVALNSLPANFSYTAITASQGGISRPCWLIYEAVGATNDAFDGVLTGKLSFYREGTNVGDVPFGINTGGAVSIGTQVFSSGIFQGGITNTGKVGSLSAYSDASGLTSTIPAVEINGEIDEIRVSGTANYGTSAPPGIVYCGIVSTN